MASGPGFGLFMYLHFLVPDGQVAAGRIAHRVFDPGGTYSLAPTRDSGIHPTGPRESRARLRGSSPSRRLGC